MEYNKNKKNYYEILGIDTNATQDEIRKAFRFLSLKWHPDRNKDNPDSTSIFQSINEAYETLHDEDKKKIYDLNNNFTYDNNEYNKEKQKKFSSPFHFQFQSPFDFNYNKKFNNDKIDDFIHLFTSNLFNQMNKTENNDNNIDNDSDGDNYNNSELFTIFNSLLKPKTHTKHTKHTKPANIEIVRSIPPSITKTINIPIEKAFTGCIIPVEITRKITEENIVKEENETLYITIPQGIDDNEIILIEGKGHCLDNVKSDVKIQIKIDNDTYYKRNGLDLIFNKTISLKEALCGFSFNMKFINGKSFKINNKPGTIIQPNFKKIIQGMGMVRDNNIGNLIIVFDVTFPETISIDTINTLNKIL